MVAMTDDELRTMAGDLIAVYQRDRAAVDSGDPHDRTPFVPLVDRIFAALQSVRDGQWQPIATLSPSRHKDDLFFWIVPKTPEETWCEPSGKPIVAAFAPYLYRGKYKHWSALSKATHWHEMLPPPAAERSEP